MAIVIPDEMEAEFKQKVADLMEEEHIGHGGNSDWEECAFCHASSSWGSYRGTIPALDGGGGYKPIEHYGFCLGAQLLALESVEVVEEIEPVETVECPDCVDGRTYRGFPCHNCGGSGILPKE